MSKLSNKIRGALATALVTFALTNNANAQVMPYSLENGVWEQLTFPGVVANEITVQQYFDGTALTPAGMFPAGQLWALYEFDPFLGSSGGYVEMGPGSFLKPGIGYWIAQLTGSDVVISQAAGTKVAGFPYDGCNDGNSANDDVLKDLCTLRYVAGERGPLSVGTGAPWRLIGNGGGGDITFLDILFGGLTSTDGRAFSDPRWRDEPLAYRWDSATGGYITLHSRVNEESPIPSWAALWLGTRDIPNDETVALLLPSRLEKVPPQCPAACFEVQAPPPPPEAPDPFVEIITTADSNSSTLNDIKSVSVADTAKGFFFTVTAKDGNTPSMCEINTLSAQGDVVTRGALLADFTPITDIDFAGCVQVLLGSEFKLVPPLPTSSVTD
jgi:hypothetical protein